MTEWTVCSIFLSPPEGLSHWLNPRPTDESVGYYRVSPGDKVARFDAELWWELVTAPKRHHDDVKHHDDVEHHDDVRSHLRPVRDAR